MTGELSNAFYLFDDPSLIDIIADVLNEQFDCLMTFNGDPKIILYEFFLK